MLPPSPPLDATTLAALRHLHRKIEASEESHPVAFDDVWKLVGYSRKDNAKRALKGPGIDGQFVSSHSRESSSGTTSAVKGPAPETIMMTVKCFKQFCLSNHNPRGRQIGLHYTQLEEESAALLADNVGLVDAANSFRAEVVSGQVTAAKRLQALAKKVDDLSSKTNQYVEARKEAEARFNQLDQRRKEWQTWLHENIAATEEAYSKAISGTKRKWSEMMESINAESETLAKIREIQDQTITTEYAAFEASVEAGCPGCP